MATSSIFTHPIFQPGLVPIEEQRAMAERVPSAGQPLAITPTSQTLREVRLDDDPEKERELAWKLARTFRQRRSGWLGHLRSFIAVNSGLATINIVSGIAAGNLHPWFLYVVAGWGIGFVIHGLTYQGWVRDRQTELERASELLGIPLRNVPLRRLKGQQVNGGTDVDEEIRVLPSSSPVDAGNWTQLIASCAESLQTARQTLDRSTVTPDVTAELSGQLQVAEETVARARDAALAIRRAIAEVAPNGVEALQAERDELEHKISETEDKRLASLISANSRLLAARRDKIAALQAEEERLEATVVGVQLAAQNIRLDAARLNAGQVPEITNALSDSLRQLNDEVEIACQVETELGRL